MSKITFSLDSSRINRFSQKPNTHFQSNKDHRPVYDRSKHLKVGSSENLRASGKNKRKVCVPLIGEITPSKKRKDRFVDVGIETIIPETPKIQRTIPVIESVSTGDNWDFDIFEESKEGSAAIINSCKLPLKVSKNYNKFALLNKSNTIQCNCGKDLLLPCCSRGKRWVKLMFENKGVKFRYDVYKKQYQVVLTIIYRKF